MTSKKSDASWAEQAEAILKRRRATMKAFEVLVGEPKRIAMENAEQIFKNEMMALLPHRPMTFINTVPTTYTGAIHGNTAS